MRSKNAPNVKCLPKDKFTEAIIFAGADAFAHAQHWSESEGKKAGDDVPPVYLGKKQLVDLESLQIVDSGRQCVRVIRAGDIGEAYLTVIARKLAMAGVKEARLFNGMYEHKPVEDWSSRLPGYREEAARGESVVVSLPVAKREPKADPADELKPRVESRNDGLYWITPKVDKDSGEIINNETWLCSPLEVVGSGSDGAERYLVLRWRSPRGQGDITRAIPCADIGERDGWRSLKAGGVNVTTKSTFRAILADWLQQCGAGHEWIITHTTGWHHGAYIMPDGEVIGEPETPILLTVAARHLPGMPLLVRPPVGGIPLPVWPVATLP
jgi:putative DNA primase/helicase